ALGRSRRPGRPARRRPRRPASGAARRLSARAASRTGTACTGSSAPLAPSALQRRPHLPVALRGPDARMVETLRLVIGARDIERHAVLVDGEVLEPGVHHLAAAIERLLQRDASRGAPGDGAVERGQEIAGELDALLD